MYEDIVKSLKLCGTSLQPYENDCVTNHDGCCEAEPTCMYELMRKSADVIEELSEQLENETEYATALSCYVPQWIPVTERLPKNGEYVLCFCRANIVCVLRRDKDGDWYENPTHVYMNGFVTHWIPIPDPPEKER